MTGPRDKKQNVSWSYLFIRTTLKNENMGQANLKELLKFPNFIQIFLFHDQATEQEIRRLLGISISKKFFQKRKSGAIQF